MACFEWNAQLELEFGQQGERCSERLGSTEPSS